MGLSKAQPGLVATGAQESLEPSLPALALPTSWPSAPGSLTPLSANLMQSWVICPGIDSRSQDSS